MNIQEFNSKLEQSKVIELLFKQHPKYPFLSLGDDIEEHVLLSLFWLYMVKPYTDYFNDDWIDYSYNYYESFRMNEGNSSILSLNFYGKQSKRYFSLAPIGYHSDKFLYDHFSINTGIDDFWAEVSGNKDDELYFLGLGVDLRHPQAMEMARNFMHAFFIEKLPLEAMEQKMADFDAKEGKIFKRLGREVDSAEDNEA